MLIFLEEAASKVKRIQRGLDLRRDVDGGSSIQA
jgi:hypothetical protein